MDLVQLNNIRKLNGLEPLDKLPADMGGEPDTPPAKTKEELEAEAAAATASSKTPPITLDDAALLDILKQRGISVDSLEALKPAATPEPEPTPEEIEIAKMTFGLNKGLFTKKVYDSYVIDSKSPDGLVYAEYYADAKKEDPTLTDEAIEEEFREEYGLDAAPTSRKYLRGQRDLKSRSKEIIQEKYGKVLSVDSEFEKDQNARKAEKTRQQNILKATPKYTEDVKAVMAELTKVPVKFNEQESYEADVMSEYVSEVQQLLMDPETLQHNIEKGYNRAALKDIAWNILLRKGFPVIVQEIATQYAKKHQKGSHGIPEGGAQRSKNTDSEVQLTEMQERYKQMAEKEVVPANN